MTQSRNVWAAYGLWALAESAVVFAVVFVLVMIAGAVGWLGFPPKPNAIPILLVCFIVLAKLLHWVDDRANEACGRLAKHLIERWIGEGID